MVLQAVDGGAVVDVKPAPPPPVVPPAPPPPTTQPPAAGTTVHAPGPQLGPEAPAPASTPHETPQPPPPATTPQAAPSGTSSDIGVGSATPDQQVYFDSLESFNDSLKKPKGVGQLWDTMWTTIWTRPPAVHTKIQGLNDGTQDLFKSTPYIY